MVKSAIRAMQLVACSAFFVDRDVVASCPQPLFAAYLSISAYLVTDMLSHMCSNMRFLLKSLVYSREDLVWMHDRWQKKYDALVASEKDMVEEWAPLLVNQQK